MAGRGMTCALFLASCCGPVFPAILTNGSWVLQRFSHALLTHSHKLTHITLFSLSLSLSCSVVAHPLFLSARGAERGSHTRYSLPPSICTHALYLTKSWIPPSHTCTVHTLRLDTIQQHTSSNTELSAQLTPPALSLSDSVSRFSHIDPAPTL